MRVLFLSTSGHLGGAERVLVDMVRAIITNGGTAGVLTVEDGPLTAAVADAAFVHPAAAFALVDQDHRRRAVGEVLVAPVHEGHEDVAVVKRRGAGRSAA